VRGLPSRTAQETLPWSWYSEPELLRREQERIFRRAWPYAGPPRGRARMKLSLVCLAAAVFVLPACGSSPPSTESVVRAWSQALNTDDNEQAANLFAPGAEVVQPGQVLTLRTHTEAVQWNARLPCAGRIVSIESEGQTATATFELGDRPHSRCDGPGQRATAVFKVVKGKIVLWHQTGSSEGGPAI
jgi:limonene-1,2-epoxide hydrolase